MSNDDDPVPVAAQWAVTSIQVHKSSFQVSVRVPTGLDVHPDTANRLALLIEAAPRMLDAIIAIDPYLDHIPGGIGAEIQDVRDAIAKAQGKAP